VGLPSSTAKRSDAVPANNVLVTWVDLLTGVSSTLERGRRDRIGACVCVFFFLHTFLISAKRLVPACNDMVSSVPFYMEASGLETVVEKVQLGKENS
jgi:hypothetical protein